MFKYLKNESGQSMVIVALMLIVLLGFGALAVDVGAMTFERSSLQNAADAAALAGVKDMSESVARSYAKKNFPKLQDDNIRVNTSYNGDPDKIEVIIEMTVNHALAGVLGIHQSDMKVRAVATRPSSYFNEVFDYAVFAGEGSLVFTGGKHIIGGSVYGRDGIVFNGNDNKIEGNAVSPSTSISITGIIEGSIIKKYSVIPMPDLYAELEEFFTVYPNQESFYTALAANGGVLPGHAYINGDLIVNTRIKGSGIVCARGNITANNASQTSADSITFYSRSGDITFNGGTSEIHGILYAPNGTVTDNGGPNGHLNGRIIAKEVNCNGSKFSVTADISDFDSFKNIIVGSIRLVE